mmetsp:Transcript_25500/g.71319  ORF Transcript_25500/g.71319 Transcript_25500/m.71319 type:complete len:205 (+) Transcript_25500:838-1452(+)
MTQPGLSATAPRIACSLLLPPPSLAACRLCSALVSITKKVCGPGSGCGPEPAGRGGQVGGGEQGACASSRTRRCPAVAPLGPAGSGLVSRLHRTGRNCCPTRAMLTKVGCTRQRKVMGLLEDESQSCRLILRILQVEYMMASSCTGVSSWHIETRYSEATSEAGACRSSFTAIISRTTASRIRWAMRRVSALLSRSYPSTCACG